MGVSRSLMAAAAFAVIAAGSARAVDGSPPLTVPRPDVGAAGGGSGGFGGGGGGGGGGGFGGGGGGGGFGGGGGGGYYSNDPRAVLVGFALIAAFFVAVWILGKLAQRAQMRVAVWSRQYAAWRDDSTRRKRQRRAREVPPAAISAAEDDTYFAPDTVTASADHLFREIQVAWDQRDRAALRRMVAPELMVEWERRLDDFDAKGWHNRVEVKDLGVEYVGLTNRDDDDEDLMVVRVSAVMEDYVRDGAGRVVPHSGNPSTRAYLREYWTLGVRDGAWVLLSIEQDVEGEHHLTAPLVARPEEDVSGLRDEAVVERGVEERSPSGTVLGELIDVDFADDAFLAARDLSLVDGRLDPDVIGVSVRRVIAAWAAAVDGDDAALAGVASPDLVRRLLHPGGPETRLVVRGLRVEDVTVVGVEAAEPVRVAVDARVRGVRYVEDRDTVVVVAGDRGREVVFTERFTLGLADDAEAPWRLADVSDVTS